MSIRYVQKNANAAQIKRECAASLFDSSSQNESLQFKAGLTNQSAQYSRTSENNQKMNVVQCMGQDEIEEKMGSQFGVDKKTIDDYGGFCGGWSLLMLENPKEASEKWKEFENYVDGNTPVDVDNLKKIFKDVVKRQLYLSNADGDRDSEDFDYKLATESLEEKFLGKVNGYKETKNKQYTPFVTNPILFSRDVGPEPEENVEKNIFRKLFIRYDILGKVKTGKWLLSTDAHYMSIAFDEECNRGDDLCCGYLSETNTTGLARFESQNELVDILAKEDSWIDSNEIFKGHLIYKCAAKKIG